ncbi:hypothetical protein CSPX01_04790 [Colletotrichum filicis]|nr:hypothetical protein CSPX01_04790 [Colletotrichum filicis]
MFSWHDKACKSLNISFPEGADLPICAGNKCKAPHHGRTLATPDPALPAPAPKTTFELTWPSSLNLVDREASSSSLVKEGSAEPKPSSLDDAGRNVVSHPGQHTPSQQKPTNDSPFRDENSYQPLVARKTRLIDLIGGSYHDPIRIELHIADLAVKPEYEALSYTWADENGDSSKCERVYIGKRWDILPITKNCSNALRRLRYQNRPRRLWVDAICINQNDVGERSHQVGIMQNIYATASRVLIYLGEDKDDLNSTSSSPWNFDKWNTYYKRSLHAHNDLTQRSYFKRVWVIQEIDAAQDCWVLYGTKGDRWLDFLESKQLRPKQDWFHVLPRGRLMDLRELPKLLQATLQCQATDPRDKVYALLGLFPGAKEAQLTADYSLSLDQVFSGLTACMLCQSSALMLPIFAALEPSTSSLPASWVVDWSSATNLDCMGPYLAENDSRPTTESDTGRVSFIPRFHHNGLLVLRGRLITSLSSCVFGPECQRGPPGVLGRVFYGGRGTKVPDVLPNWAEPTDELCQIQGFDGHALVLRPVPKALKTYRFVAICKQPVFQRVLRCLNSIDRTAILLFSTWRYILTYQNVSWLWFLAKTWNAIEAICRSIKHFWNLEKTLCRNLDCIRGPRCGKSQPCEEEAQEAPYKVGNPNPQEVWPEHEGAPGDSKQLGDANQSLSKNIVYDSAVLQPCLEQTFEDHFNSLAEHLSTAVENFRYSSRRSDRTSSWNSLSDLKAHLSDLKRRVMMRKERDSLGLRGRHFPDLGEHFVSGLEALALSIDLSAVMLDLGWEFGSFTGIPTAEKLVLIRRDPGSYQHRFPWNFEDLEEKAIEVLMDNIEGSSAVDWRPDSSFMLPDSFTATLLNQDLGGKLTFFDQSTLEYQNYNAGTNFSRDRVLPWLQDALNLESRPLPTGESYRNAHLDTWAADFIRTWTLLTKDIRPDWLLPIRPEDLPPQETEERLLREQGYLAAAEAKWAPLLDLVKYTEARLLPMKETFIRAEDTHDESMDDVPWEDIFIA